MMRRIVLLVAVLLLTGCRPRPLYTPEAQVTPAAVGFGGIVRLKLYGAEIVSYQFLGAVPGPDGTWLVRLNPITLRVLNTQGQLVARPGDVLPMGAGPAIRVRFVRIEPTELELEAVDVYREHEPD
jgi:hypothetical protein